MYVFNLDRIDNWTYVISVNGREIASERYYSETKALEWARGFVSSWQSVKLNIMFDLLPTMEEYNEKKNSIHRLG